MALGDVGPFLPAESNYGTPGAYDKMLQAEALKRAAFLSNMDQFYENLEEATRQFDETLSFKTETRDLELDWAREKHTKDLAFERERLEAEKTYNEGMLGLREREIAGDEGSELTSFERFKLFNIGGDQQFAKTFFGRVLTNRGDNFARNGLVLFSYF